MKKRIPLFWILILLSIQSIAQNRTIDGTSNNLQNTNWGAAGHQLRSITTTSFEDGISSLGGTNRPNPRIISNTIFAQDSLLNDPMALSDFTWVFGQFIDHDVIATPSDPTEDVSIDVNFPDVHFNPGGAFPFIQIHLSRSRAHPGTGTDVNNPRGYTNDITSWIDGSSVYGSDIERANYLRTFVDGKLKTSAGNLLPFNTDTHEHDGIIDATAPVMENENPFNEHLMVAGDARANENVALAAVHTLFVREHNRLCEELILAHPDWTDEELYQYARKMVGGFIQSIVYNEWLPAMGVHLDAYSGYDPTIDATITNVFSAAAFRLGHTLLSGKVLRTDNLGNTIPDGDLTLLEAFFAPLEIVENDGIDPIFKGMATQVQQKLDCKIVDDVRNFLFGPPQAGLGGLDLAAINIQRGRERGLPDFNTLRADVGLSPYASFSEINSDEDVMTLMENLYGDVNDIDPWVGLLAEEHMADALFGPTIMKIMEEQFFALREGDRFYFENDPVLSVEKKAEINTTTFRDILMRNTGITVMQMNVFEAMPHDSICPANVVAAHIQGTVKTFAGEEVEGVEVAIQAEATGQSVGNLTTGQDGDFLVEDLQTCNHYAISAEKDYNYRNGVSTFDILFIRRHILEIEQFNNPYKALAADVNSDGNISTLDMVDMRKLILVYQDTFTHNKSWRFVDEAITYADPNRPEEAIFDETMVNYLPGNTNVNFVGIKIGDVTGDANPAAFTEEIEARDYAADFILSAADLAIEAGNDYSFTIQGTDIERLVGLQFALNFDPQSVHINEVIPGDVANLSKANFSIEEEHGRVAVSWDSEVAAATSAFFTVKIRALEDGQLSDFIRLDTEQMRAEAYTKDLAIQGLDLNFETTDLPASAFELYQNTPNPFREQTSIRFFLPLADDVDLIIYDVSGKILYRQAESFSAGLHAVDIDQALLNASGVLYYQVNASFGSATKKMVLLQP